MENNEAPINRTDDESIDTGEGIEFDRCREFYEYIVKSTKAEILNISYGKHDVFGSILRAIIKQQDDNDDNFSISKLIIWKRPNSDNIEFLSDYSGSNE